MDSLKAKVRQLLLWASNGLGNTSKDKLKASKKPDNGSETTSREASKEFQIPSKGFVKTSKGLPKASEGF